jgi:thiol-disulfide isomerase/thioredoxin
MPRGRRHVAASLLVLFGLALPLRAANPSAEQALKLRPVQADVEYDVPTGESIKGCTISGGKVNGASGWIVRDATGHLLRSFVDSNGDNVVDLWCYYRNGVEVYRDIDSNFNGKADQYRWLHTAGMRWGLDKDENGTIDEWKMISPEEVTAEVVKAVAQGDAHRFGLVLLDSEDLKALGLGEEKHKEVASRLAAATEGFERLKRGWPGKPENTKWLHFGAMQPGVVPADKGSLERDLTVYENVVALIEADGKPSQLWIGTLVQVGNTWRVIEAPRIVSEADQSVAEGGIFFRAPAPQQPAAAQPQGGAADEKLQKLLAELEELDRQVAQAKAEDKPKLHQQRVEMLEQLAEAAATPQDRNQWLRQLADTVSAATQAGNFPDGPAKLKAWADKETAAGGADSLAAYFKYRYLTAEYTISLQAEKPDFAKLQEQWHKNLQQFVTDYPNSSDTAEALLQLAIAQDGDEEKAMTWYKQIVDNFGNSPAAGKARGALTRLKSVGQTIQLSGKTTTGAALDLAQYRGKVVLIHYWSTWCEPCVADMAKIKELFAQHGRAGFAPIGVNLDADKKALDNYLAENRLPWPQLYEPGSLDGRLANELGILTLPTMILVDRKGKVVNRNLNINELEAELKKYLQQQ